MILGLTIFHLGFLAFIVWALTYQGRQKKKREAREQQEHQARVDYFREHGMLD